MTSRSGITPVNGIDVHYRIDGSQGPWVVFANSLLTDLSIWEQQVAVLAHAYRVLRFDHRGHGLSGSSHGSYTFDLLADDLVAVLDALGIERAHLVGISIGANTAALVAHRRPDRVLTVTMCDCQPNSSGTSKTLWECRILQAETRGLEPIAASALERWFSLEFLETNFSRTQELKSMMLRTSKEGYVGNVSALLDYDLRSVISSLSTPLLLLAGAHDGSAPEVLAGIATQLPHATFKVVPEAGHLSCVDGAAFVSDALATFLNDHTNG